MVRSGALHECSTRFSSRSSIRKTAIGGPCAPAQERTHAGRKLRKRKGFQHTIVRAHVEFAYAIDDLASIRQHQNRQLLPRHTQVLQNGEAVILRQAQIQDGQIVVVGLGQGLHLLSVLSQVDGIIFGLESSLKKNAQR